MEDMDALRSIMVKNITNTIILTKKEGFREG